jgi:hypothetical protein
MLTLVGQVLKFLQEPDGEVTGLVMEGGQEVRFPFGQGHMVPLIVAIGSRVGIEGKFCSKDAQGEYLEATLITNFDSKRSMNFSPPTGQDKPGMLLDSRPDSRASLVPRKVSGKVESAAKETIKKDDSASPDPYLEQPIVTPISHSFHSSRVSSYERALCQASEVQSITASEAATSIGRAYDRLHRVQAILAYLHILQRQVPGVSQFLDEVKHTYEQSLSRYALRNYVAAIEFAAASADLSRVVEIVIARTLRSDTSLPSLVPPPPENSSLPSEPARIEERLAETQSVLSRIHRVLENRSLPLEDRTQVRKIASWGDALQKQAQRMCRHGALPDAAELAEAALAGAHSAEHVCRKWYVGQSAHAESEASGQLRPQ